LKKNSTKFNNHTKVALHELCIAHKNFSDFSKNQKHITINNEKKDKFLYYQAYAEFIRSLFEYYKSLIEWNNTLGYDTIKDIDEFINDAAQRLMNFYEPIKDSLEHKKHTIVPNSFGSDFRYVRNKISHVDFKRIENDKISLSLFYKKYHYYVKLMVEHAYQSWNGDYTQYSESHIENFVSTTTI